MTQHNWFYSQLFTNWKRFEVIYVTILILLQPSCRTARSA